MYQFNQTAEFARPMGLNLLDAQHAELTTHILSLANWSLWAGNHKPQAEHNGQLSYHSECTYGLSVDVCFSLFQSITCQ
jgi:hypothetical protein